MGSALHTESPQKAASPRDIEALRPRRASASSTPHDDVLNQLRAPLPPLERALAAAFGRELVRGDWELKHRFDRDGRRFFVWQRNEANPMERRALTERETVVLARVARGLGDRAVSQELGCSTSTVATHRLRAMAKLGIASRTLLAQVLSGVSLEAE